MVEGSHTIDVNWREAQALGLEMKALAINQWLEHTEDLVEMFEHDETIASALRGVAGSLRAQRNDILAAARNLRVEITKRD